MQLKKREEVYARLDARHDARRDRKEKRKEEAAKSTDPQEDVDAFVAKIESERKGA